MYPLTIKSLCLIGLFCCPFFIWSQTPVTDAELINIEVQINRQMQYSPFLDSH